MTRHWRIATADHRELMQVQREFAEARGELKQLRQRPSSTDSGPIPERRPSHSAVLRTIG